MLLLHYGELMPPLSSVGVPPGGLRPVLPRVRFGASELSGRMRDEDDREELLATVQMTGSFLDAWHRREAGTSG